MNRFASALMLSLLPGLAQAASLDGATLSLAWGLPFAGILLSIALFPIFAPGFFPFLPPVSGTTISARLPPPGRCCSCCRLRRPSGLAPVPGWWCMR